MFFSSCFVRKESLRGEWHGAHVCGGYSEGAVCGTCVGTHSAHGPGVCTCAPSPSRLHPSSVTLTSISSLAPRKVEEMRARQKPSYSK